MLQKVISQLLISLLNYKSLNKKIWASVTSLNSTWAWFWLRVISSYHSNTSAIVFALLIDPIKLRDPTKKFSPLLSPSLTKFSSCAIWYNFLSLVQLDACFFQCFLYCSLTQANFSKMGLTLTLTTFFSKCWVICTFECFLPVKLHKWQSKQVFSDLLATLLLKKLCLFLRTFIYTSCCSAMQSDLLTSVAQHRSIAFVSDTWESLKILSVFVKDTYHNFITYHVILILISSWFSCFSYFR